MEAFVEFVFGNPILVFVIIAALFNILNKGKKSNEEQQKPRPVQPTQMPRQSNQERETIRTRLEKTIQEQAKQLKTTIEQSVAKTEQSVEKTIEEQRQAQYDRLRSQYSTSTTEKEIGENVSFIDEKIINDHHELEKVSVNLEKKLTTKGLMESVMMAEILGPPRAHNPYQNIVVKRQQR